MESLSLEVQQAPQGIDQSTKLVWVQVVLDDLDGSLSTQHILRFYNGNQEIYI